MNGIERVFYSAESLPLYTDCLIIHGFRIEDWFEWFVVGFDWHIRMTQYVHVNFSNAQAIPNASFSITDLLLSVSVSERDFDATNRRVPSGCTWKLLHLIHYSMRRSW